MRERDPLECAQLALLELHVDDGPLVAHDDHLSVLVFLLDGETGLGDSAVTRINTLRQPNNRILLSNLERLFETLDGALLSVNFINVRVLKVSQHLIIDILGRSIQISQLPCVMQVLHILVETL